MRDLTQQPTWRKTMTLFSNPTDLLALAFFALTLTAVILITLAKDMTRREKYGALAVTFVLSAIVDVLAIYSLAITAGFCLLMAAVFFRLWLRARQRTRSIALNVGCRPELAGNSNATLLPESNPPLLKTIRLLGRG